MRISVYSPGYLFKGPRPTIDAAPAVMDNGTSYDVAVTVPSGAGVRDVSLIRAGSVTHQFDPNLRLVDVPFTETAGGLSLDVPDNPNLLPPGPYMLVVTDHTVCRPWPAGSRSRPSRVRRARRDDRRTRPSYHESRGQARPAAAARRTPGALLLRGAELLAVRSLWRATRGGTDRARPEDAPVVDAERRRACGPGEIDYGPDGGPSSPRPPSATGATTTTAGRTRHGLRADPRQTGARPGQVRRRGADLRRPQTRGLPPARPQGRRRGHAGPGPRRRHRRL